LTWVVLIVEPKMLPLTSKLYAGAFTLFTPILSPAPSNTSNASDLPYKKLIGASREFVTPRFHLFASSIVKDKFMSRLLAAKIAVSGALPEIFWVLKVPS